jgi:hypothetical protein
MPDPQFTVFGVEPVVQSLAPLLHFKLQIRNEPASELIHGMLLHAQIQIQCPQRAYSAIEKEELVEIFGPPERWGETLRNKFWTHSDTSVNAFTGETEAILPVPCTFDLNILATKYFLALETEDVPLLFLFSGSVFYAAADGRFQVQRISWEKEALFRMPLRAWQELMTAHFPNTAWITVQRDVFEGLCAFKRRHGLSSWEQAFEQLLPQSEKEEVPA